MSSCRIVLKHSGSYHPGKKISGHVICIFDSRTKFRAIRVRLRGKEHTSWWERESYYNSSSKKTEYRNVEYTGNNTIISYDESLVGEGSLSAGRYEYPFTFTLPRDLPTTYEGGHGYIKYYVKANVDIPLGFDYEDSRSLNLISLINFNEIIDQLQLNPVDYEDEKTLCCCCCASDPITMKLHLEKEAFVLGEVAKINVDVTNMSNTSLEGLEISVNMIIESKATSPETKYKYDKDMVTSKSSTGVGAHGQRTYEFDLEIPMTAVLLNFTRSTLFKQWCEIKVEAVLPGCHSNMTIEASIVLGHIPIDGPSTNFLPPASITSVAYIPGGAFPSHVVSDEYKPPPYPMGDSAPPYPTGPPMFPTAPAPSDIGFVVPGDAGDWSSSSLSAKRMPVPVHGPVSPEPSSSAPPDQSAPSAPAKAEMAESEDFMMIDEEHPTDPPPPSYHDALRGPFITSPGAGRQSGASHPTSPPGAQNGHPDPSAPPL